MSKALLKAVRTTRPTTQNLTRDVYLFDASKQPVGRIATEAARVLTGKNRPDYSPDVNMGGKVVIINTDQLVLTGNKATRKNYFRHSQRPGSLKVTTLPQQMEKDSTVVLYKAIRNMIPRNRLKDVRMNQLLSLYKGNHDLTQQMIEAN